MFGVSSIGAYRAYAYSYGSLNAQGVSKGTEAIDRVAPAQTTPVPPVSKTAPVQRGVSQPAAQDDGPLSFVREGADFTAMAVRGRIQYAEDGASQGGMPAENVTAEAAEETKSAQEVMEEGECQTCKERKYQDGSNDPGVSFKTPSRIAPEQAAAVVRGHEQEHVVREQAQARRENREVVSQSVTLHTAICPECGKAYVSGGTTRTTTRADSVSKLFEQQQEQPSLFQSVA